MVKGPLHIAACLIGAALLLGAVYLVRPIAEMSPIRQVKGTEFTKPYLGRALEVVDGDEVSQSFTAPKTGLLNGIGIYAPIPNRLAIGPVKVSLYKLKNQRRSRVFAATSDISRLANNEGLSIYRFKPIAVSKGDRFVIRLAPKAKPSFFLFFNSRGDAYKGGTAFLDAKRLQVDLAFQVFYKLDAGGFWRHLATGTPNLIPPAPLAFLLALTWLATAALFSSVWRIKGSPAYSAKDR